MRLCRIVTVPETFAALLLEQLRYIARHGIDLTLVSAPGEGLVEVARDVGVESVGVPMVRQPSPAADLQSLMRLTRVLQRGRFDIVHSTTPKAGLLTAIAARLAGVPIRIHTFTGQPWVELAGLRRRIPREADRLIARLSTRCYADSPSQREFLIAEGLAISGSIDVIGNGSLGGVDVDRFSLTRWGGATAIETRRELTIPDDVPVVVFVGRVTRDKGIVELTRAFEALAARDPRVHLLLVGPFEPDRDPLPPETLDRLTHHPRIRSIGFTRTPEKYLAVADVFCLPSYREGFPNAVVEAAAMELPAVIAGVTGSVDTVVEGVTGLVVPPKDSAALAQALERLLASRELRRGQGTAARARVIRDFSATRVNEGVVAEYWRLMGQPGGPGSAEAPTPR
jgi:glycosyltransferase involved in cell wall biosynthesis